MSLAGEPTARADASQWLGAIVQSARDAIVSMDLAGTVTSWNPGAEQLFGHRAGDIIGRPVWRIAPESRLAELQALIARVRAGGRVPSRDTRLLHRDGHDLDVALSVSLVHDPDGEPIGFSVLIRDITERKLAEQDLRRLLSETQHHERSARAVSEIRLALLGGAAIDTCLALIAARARELVVADGVVVSIPDERGTLRVAAAEGPVVTHLAGIEVPPHSTSARVFSSGRVHSAAGPHAAPLLDTLEIGPVLAAPLPTSSGTGGVLSVVRRPDGSAFDAEETRLLRGFAEQAALALELARGRADSEKLALVADRERIARDLHDHVIQRLFAVGMSLQTALTTMEDHPIADRVGRAVDDLDTTIREVRSAIFALELANHQQVSDAMRAGVLLVTDQAVDALGFAPRVRFEGPVDTVVPGGLLPDVTAVVREALSNVAKHAGASTVEVSVRAGDVLAVTVSDNGRGMGAVERSSGLTNLRTRAEQRGGEFTVTSDEHGTSLDWRVPLDHGVAAHPA